MATKTTLSFEISGTEALLAFDQERLNELRLCRVGQDGFQRLLAGPSLPGYAAFSPAAGHRLGYNELKTLEVQELIMAVAGQESMAPTLKPRGRWSGWRRRFAWLPGGALGQRELGLNMWEGALLPMAVCQTKMSQLGHRHRASPPHLDHLHI